MFKKLSANDIIYDKDFERLTKKQLLMFMRAYDITHPTASSWSSERLIDYIYTILEERMDSEFDNSETMYELPIISPESVAPGNLLYAKMSQTQNRVQNLQTRTSPFFIVTKKQKNGLIVDRVAAIVTSNPTNSNYSSKKEMIQLRPSHHIVEKNIRLTIGETPRAYVFGYDPFHLQTPRGEEVYPWNPTFLHALDVERLIKRPPSWLNSKASHQTFVSRLARYVANTPAHAQNSKYVSKRMETEHAARLQQLKKIPSTSKNNMGIVIQRAFNAANKRTQTVMGTLSKNMRAMAKTETARRRSKIGAAYQRLRPPPRTGPGSERAPRHSLRVLFAMKFGAAYKRLYKAYCGLSPYNKTHATTAWDTFAFVPLGIWVALRLVKGCAEVAVYIDEEAKNAGMPQAVLKKKFTDVSVDETWPGGYLYRRNINAARNALMPYVMNIKMTMRNTSVSCATLQLRR